VVWVITVEVFLVALAAGVSILFFFYQRDQNQKALKEPEQKRMEGRTRFRVDVELISTDEPLMKEITVTENISRYGACVVTKGSWRPNASLTVKLLREDLPYNARIAYCNPLTEEAFAVGMQFTLPVVSWMVRPISRL
jgi:hypothetical protein